jgi:murein DD-endopeptidase MepM/ murein hydrolase activator NlpD
MLGRRFTLLIIPEEGGQTFELKVRRFFIWVLLGMALAVATLLGLGMGSFLRVQRLEQVVVQLRHEKKILEEEFLLVEDLEKDFQQLAMKNRQLQSILIGPKNGGEDNELLAGADLRHQYISSTKRLETGKVRSVPTLWPTRGQVKRFFDPTFAGVIIANPVGSLIRASAQGQVLQAEFDQQLGYMVRIDHGNGILTVYGYNSRLLVHPGDYVRKGHPIAFSGQSGATTWPGLYYAVREDGKPRDPLLYRLWL